jgi:hypothetical protein
MRIECRSNNVGGTSFQNLSVIIDRPPDAGESVAKRISSLSATSALSLGRDGRLGVRRGRGPKNAHEQGHDDDRRSSVHLVTSSPHAGT